MAEGGGPDWTHCPGRFAIGVVVLTLGLMFVVFRDDPVAPPAVVGPPPTSGPAVSAEPTPNPTGPAPTTGATLARGTAEPGGYWYDVTLWGFPPFADVPVRCYDSSAPDPFRTVTLHTDQSGGASDDRACYSATGADHWVRAGTVESNHLQWTG